MPGVKVTYVLTTYNKIAYVRHVMNLLQANVQGDEEIIVTDAGSTDGTAEYFSDLFNQGKISYFISEPDKGEAHGYNKAILAAKGEFIKVIYADDIFSYPVIRSCIQFMEQNTAIDLMTGMVAMAYLGDNEKVDILWEFLDEFKKWSNGEYERLFCNGQSLLIRRSSLPLLGLFNNDFVYMDAEFTLRASRAARIAFCKQCVAIRVTNPHSKALQNEHGKSETIQLLRFYNHPIPPTWQEQQKKRLTILSIRIFLSKVKKRLQGLPPFVPSKNSSVRESTEPEIEEFFHSFGKKLDQINCGIEPAFFWK